MKLLLTSEGLTTPAIIESFEKLCGKKQSEISMGIINEGYVPENGDQRWSIKEMNHVICTVGGTVDLINLLALSKEQIFKRAQKVDVIYVLGGHTDYLMSVFNKSGLSELLPELLKSKIYVGSSAGSMVLCRRVSTIAYQEIYGEEGDYGVKKYLEFADFALKPHLDSAQFAKNRKENLIKVSASFDGRLFGLRDDQAIEVNGSQINYIGGHPLELLHGEEVA
jgi:dipeptidase E